MSSLKKEFTTFPTQEQTELHRAFNAVLADLTAMRAEMVALAAQLDGDTGVNETDYNTLVGGALTLTE